MTPDELIEREQVRKLIREILCSGEVIFMPHAEEQLDSEDAKSVRFLMSVVDDQWQSEEFAIG